MSGASSRVCILGCEIDALDLDATVRACADAIRFRVSARQVSVNAAKLVSIRDDSTMRDYIASSDIVSADGQAVVWASKLLGRQLPGRVAGIDLMERLLVLAGQMHWTVFFLGARQNVLDVALVRIHRRYPALVVCGSHHGYFSDADDAQVVSSIQAAKPDIVFVAMSSPRKEQWIARNQKQLEVPFVMGVGGAIDVIAGETRRAPIVMQRAGLEWLFRLAQEPRRLFRRYLVTNVRFLGLLGLELLAGGRKA